MQIKVITDEQKYQTAVDELKEIKKLCLDTETTGLQASIAKCRLLQLCDASPDLEDRIVYVFDLFKVEADEQLKALIESRDLLVIHNANFDLQFLYRIGIDYKGKVFDTYLAERVLRAGFKEKRVSPQANKPYFADVSCSLKAVVERRLELEIDKEQQVSDWGAPEPAPRSPMGTLRASRARASTLVPVRDSRKASRASFPRVSRASFQ
jgi:ribonuclease D